MKKEVGTNAILKAYDAEREKRLRFTNALQTLLLQLLSCNGIRIHSCTSRLKERDSLERKINDKTGKYANLDEITDVTGVRVITYYPTEVDLIAEIVEREFAIDRANSIDKRAILDPDRFGYLSLHYVIGLSKSRLRLTEYREFSELKAELQIRSIVQHAWAEIQHDLGYKSKIAIPREAQRRFFRVAAILESADLEFAGLRSEIEQYEENVGSKLDAQNVANIALNTNSLTLFVQASSKVSELDRRICRAGGCRLDRKVNPRYMGGLVDDLAFARIRTIEDIQSALEKHAESLVSLATNWLTRPKRKHSRLSRGISIFYLAYILVAARSGAKGTTKYLHRFGSARTAQEIKSRTTDILRALKQAA